MTRTDSLIGLDLFGVEHCPSERTGELTFRGLPAVLQQQEDDRQAADVRILVERGVDCFYRAASDGERVLLQFIGYRLPARLETRVNWCGDGRRRSWPQLRSQRKGVWQ